MTSYTEELWFGDDEQKKINDKIDALTKEITNQQNKKNVLQRRLRYAQITKGAGGKCSRVCINLKDARIFSFFNLKKEKI